MPVADDHLGIGPDVHQQHHFLFLVQAYRKHVGSHVGADVRADERSAVHVGARKYPQPELPSLDVQRRGGPLPGQHFQLGNRLVGFFADRLDVEAEEQVAHRRVADDDPLVDAPRPYLDAAAHVADFKVDARHDSLLQLTVEGPAVVRNTVHDVAAAEALRVFEGTGVKDVAAFQIDKIQGDRGGAEIHGQPAHAAAVIVDALAFEINAVAFANAQWRQSNLTADAVRQNLRLAPQHGKFNVRTGVDNRCLAGEAVGIAQELLAGCRGVQCLHAVPDLDNALVAFAGSPAGGRHAHLEVIGVVENGLAGYGVKPVGVVIHGRHAGWIPENG